MAKRVADIVVETLRAAGVEHCWGVPGDVSKADAPDEPAFAVHISQPAISPSDAELDRIAGVLNAGRRVTIYGGSGCQHAHDEVVAL